MPSLFKRKSVAAAEVSFKRRVQQFWAWFAGAAPRFYQAIADGRASDLATEVSAKVDEVILGFAWVFGPGENGQGHSFTLSGEGDLHRQLLAIYWQSQAPSLPGWKFYGARQPGSLRGKQIAISSGKFDPLEFWISPAVNLEAKKFDITAWHPRFDKMTERERGMMVQLFLDEALGEYGTQQWIGEIKLAPKRPANSMPLEELSDFSRRVQSEHGWKKLPPGESSTVYRCKEPRSRFLRGDIVTGTTIHPRLINEYLKAEGELEDPLKGTGADYVFVTFNAQILPAGNESHARGEMEEALDQALRMSASGRLLGGAWGSQNAYIDLLLFDGPASVEIVIGVLRKLRLPAGSSLDYFAREKRALRRVI
jgi:hypothetical protein